MKTTRDRPLDLYWFTIAKLHSLDDDVSRSGAAAGDVRDTCVHCIRKAKASVDALVERVSTPL